MSWVNLNDVYVNKTGDTIAGDLSVGGALTINNGKGTNTTYNVANEITTLRDSVSRAPRIRQFFTSIVRLGTEWDASGMLPAITKDEYKNLVGRDFNGFDIVQVFNGDLAANAFDVINLTYWSSGNFWVDTEGGARGLNARVNIKIVAIDFE